MRAAQLETLVRGTEGRSALDIVRLVGERSGDRAGVACSFGAEDVVLVDLLCRVGAGWRVFAIDTGRRHEATYEVMDRIRGQYDIQIDVYYPRHEEVERVVALRGPYSFQKSLEARHECCGVMIGRPGETASVCSVHPAENLSSTRLHDRYEVDRGEIVKLDRAAEQRGLEIVGFYHSHPDHSPAPSATDAKTAWPGYIYIIVAVAAVGEAQVTAWTFDEERGRFRERCIRMSQEAPRLGRAAAPTRR